MRISDWSSDLCSSDLWPAPRTRRARRTGTGRGLAGAWSWSVSLLHPGVAQGHGAVEYRRAGDMVAAVGDEIAGALELESRFRRRLRSRRLHVTLHHRACIRVDVVAVGLSIAFVVRPGAGEQAVVKAEQGRPRRGRGPP